MMRFTLCYDMPLEAPDAFRREGDGDAVAVDADYDDDGSFW